jgi:hypothetical protein
VTPSLDDTCVRLERSATDDAAADLALAFLAARFAASLILLVRDGAALGHRGHGTQAASVEAFALPVASPSLVKLAIETRRLATASPTGATQDRLMRMLGNPSSPAAAPVTIAARVVGVIAVGDPLRGLADVHRATEDLEWLAEALGLAYARLLIDGKKAP